MMDEADGAQQPDPPATAGDALRAAREARGLTLDQVADRTRVARRQLEAIETGSYASLPSPTYAVGFAKAYARAVGADEVALAAQVRDEVARHGRPTQIYQPYEAPDPSRVPSRSLAIVAAGIALAIVVLVGLYFGTDLFRGGGAREVAVSAVVPAPAASAGVAPPVAKPPAPTGGQVRLTATGRVWLRVYQPDGKTLVENTLNPGDHYDVPADAKGAMLAIGRPDKVTVTLDGRPAPALGTGARAIKDVPVDGAAIAARIAGAPPVSATPTPTPTPTPSSSAETTHRGSESRSRPRSSPTPRARPTNETARANLDAAAAPPATSNSQ